MKKITITHDGHRRHNGAKPIVVADKDATPQERQETQSWVGTLVAELLSNRCGATNITIARSEESAEC